MVKKYIKKPVVIEAVQWTGLNMSEVANFVSNGLRYIEIEFDEYVCRIQTFEETMTADIGDFIVKGVKGELYICRPDIFEEAYEEVK